ncbi:MAG: TonB-dependent receptor [Acidobacteriales bacterium]|nr:TonB-dependent receptor [Terriglobales bacterium]
MRHSPIFCFLHLAAAASAAIVSGVVHDSSGAPVPDAHIELTGPVRRDVVTGIEGRFQLDALPDGTYRVTVRRDGFSVVERTATLPPSQTLDVTIEPSPVATHVETVSKTDEPVLWTPFRVSVVPHDAIEKTGANSFEDVLRSVPGLQFGTQGNAYPHISTRGLRDTADVLTLIDGVPLRQLNGSADLTMLPVPAIQEVEFVKGPASSAYGRSAVGGVMQFFTVPPARSRFTGDLGFGLASFGDRETMGSASVPWNGGRLAGSAMWQSSDGFQRGTGRDMGAVSLMGEQSVGGRLHLRGNYLFSDVEAQRGSIVPLVNGRPYVVNREDNYGIPGARFDADMHSVTGRADLAVAREWTLSNTTNFNRYDRFATGGITILPPSSAVSKGYSESNTVQDTLLSDSILTWSRNRERLRSDFLAGFTYEWGSQDQASPSFRNAPTYRGPNWNTPVSNVNNDPRGIRGATTYSDFGQDIASFYLQERLGWGRLGTVLGLRWDRFDQFLNRSDTSVVSTIIKSRLSPRVGFDVVALERGRTNLVIFGNYVQGFRPQFPALSQQGSIIIPQLLRPEVTRSLEGGLRFVSGRFFAQSTYFDMKKIDGQRSFRSGPEDFTFVNATTRVNGVESEFRARLLGHTLWSHYAHHNARNIEFRPALTSDFSGYPLRMAPKNIAGAGGLLHLWKSLTFSPGVNYVGSRPLRDNVVNPQILPSYTLLSSAVAFDLWRLRVVVSGTNLSDRYYIADDFSSQDAGCPGTPRRFSVQVRYRW